MSDLSNDARSVAAAWFGMTKVGGQGRLRFAMVEYRPSPRAQAGLDELLAAGIITRENEPCGAVTYRPRLDCRKHLVWAWKRMEDGTAERESFRLMDCIAPGKRPLKRAGTITMTPTATQDPDHAGGEVR